MVRPSSRGAAIGAMALLALALASSAAGTPIEVPISDSLLAGMAETTETLRVGVLQAPGGGTSRELARREEARLLLASALDVVGTGDVPGAARVNLRACRRVDAVLRTVRRTGTAQQIGDLEFWTSCLVDNYVGRISLAAARLDVESQGEDPLAPRWAAASERIFPLLLAAVQEFFPPEGVTRTPVATRAFRRLCRASRIAGEWCDWVVVPDPPPPG